MCRYNLHDPRSESPNRWFDYSRFGTPIRGTRIISVKTPLKKAFNNGRSRGQVQSQHLDYRRGVPTEEEFTPTQLVEQLKAAGWNLRAVIDLTFTSRYYNPKELQDLGVQHSKIFCPGKEIPSDEVYSNFSASLSNCLTSCENNDLVAVHCTHGLNRTGYLVCRYLIENFQFSAEDAIQAFNVARGFDIERKNYLEHLRKGCPLLPPSQRPSHQFQGASKRQHSQTGAHHLAQEQTFTQHKHHRRRKRRQSREPQSDPVPVPLFPNHVPDQGANPIPLFPNIKSADHHPPPTSHDHSQHDYSSERSDKFQSRNARKNKKHRKRNRSPYIPPPSPPSRHNERGRSVEAATDSGSYHFGDYGNCMEPEGLRPWIPSHGGGGAKFQPTVGGYHQPLLPVYSGWRQPRPKWSIEVDDGPHNDVAWNGGYGDPYVSQGCYSRENPFSWHRQDKVVEQYDSRASP